MARGLLLIDIQNDYFPGGAMELVGMEQAGDNARQVLEAFRKSGEPIFHVQHISTRPESGFFQPNSTGVEINERVKPSGEESLTQKNFPNAFRATEIDKTLRDADIDELVVVGAMSHMCIDASTRAAFDLGYTCTVVDDACATRDLTFGDRDVKAQDVHASFMAALGWVYASIADTKSVIGV